MKLRVQHRYAKIMFVSNSFLLSITLSKNGVINMVKLAERARTKNNNYSKRQKLE